MTIVIKKKRGLAVLLILVSAYCLFKPFLIIWLSAAVFNRQQSVSEDSVRDAELVPAGIPIILYWTGYFSGKWPINTGLTQCNTAKCFVTTDKRYFINSSVLVFHGWATYLFYDVSLAQSLPRPPHQKWIYLNSESPVRTKNLYYYIGTPKANVFNWTMTYKLDSDIFFPYGEIHKGQYLNGYDPNKNYLQNKTKLAVVVVSNCVIARMRLFWKLRKHCDVDIFGDCGSPCVDCFSKIHQYKFYLAFENSLCTDYITEKTYVNALLKGLVPVILSGANLSNPVTIPPGSYIDASKFSTALELAEYLKKVGNDPSLYNKFFEWRNHWNVKLGYLDSTSCCHICERISAEVPFSSKTLADDNKWFVDQEKDCQPYKIWT